jgi:hypothetical protein
MELRFDDYRMVESERWDRLDDCPVCSGVPAPAAGERVAVTTPG